MDYKAAIIRLLEKLDNEKLELVHRFIRGIM